MEQARLLGRSAKATAGNRRDGDGLFFENHLHDVGDLAIAFVLRRRTDDPVGLLVGERHLLLDEPGFAGFVARANLTTFAPGFMYTTTSRVLPLARRRRSVDPEVAMGGPPRPSRREPRNRSERG